MKSLDQDVTMKAYVLILALGLTFLGGYFARLGAEQPAFHPIVVYNRCDASVGCS